MAAITPTSESALAMGCFCSTTLTAQMTAINAKTKKNIKSIYEASIRRSRPHRHHESGDEKIQQRDGEQELPGEAHELVVAETGQRRANPDEDEKQETQLGQKPEQRRQDGH